MALRAEEFKKMSKDERLKQKLPLNVILKIAQHMGHTEVIKLTLMCRYVRETIIYSPEFEGQWVIKSFQGLLSKSGYSGLRNNNLRLMDIQLRTMYFQS